MSNPDSDSYSAYYGKMRSLHLLIFSLFFELVELSRKTF
jgi:hypothetical protein